MMEHRVERDLVVTAREDAATDVVLLTFAAADGTPLPGWRPGSHIDLLLPDGTERQYSLCGVDLSLGTWTIAVLREADGRGGSRWIHDTLVPGAHLRGRGPADLFGLSPAPRYEFIAGGIGITPILPMIRTVDERGAEWRLSYAGRSRAAMAFAEELATMWPDRVEIFAGEEGRRLDLAGLLDGLPDGTEVYACGPSRLLDEVEQRMSDARPEALHLERFAAKTITSPLRDSPFEVELAVSGEVVTVPPQRSILDVVEETGVFALSSCREGTCGACETVVIEGEIDHRDSILSAHERTAGDRMMICVSRAACDRLVLEL